MPFSRWIQNTQKQLYSHINLSWWLVETNNKNIDISGKISYSGINEIFV